MESKGTTKAKKEAPMTSQTLSSKTFGEFSRYRLDAFQTRFGTVEYFVLDAERIDALTGLPAVIRQAATAEEATAGLR